MEGLISEGNATDPAIVAPYRERLYGRWAIFVAFSLGLLMSLLYLTAEVLNSV